MLKKTVTANLDVQPIQEEEEALTPEQFKELQAKLAKLKVQIKESKDDSEVKSNSSD
mgnify:CR=1 FL=1